MLDLGYSTRTTAHPYEYSLLTNWEEDIKGVSIENCDLAEDPLGYKVVFYKEDGDGDMSVAYIVGASLLRNRLIKLDKAGFDAPMTREALKMLEREQFSSAAVAH